MMKTLVKTITAISAGIAIGAVAGILMAPRKGEETRSIIRKKGQKIADKFQQKVRDGESLVTDVKDDLKDTMNGIKKHANQFT